jgi:hypothetical protein
VLKVFRDRAPSGVSAKKVLPIPKTKRGENRDVLAAPLGLKNWLSVSARQALIHGMAEPPEMTVREYARRRAVSRQGIAKAVARGEVPTTPAGLVDVKAADENWGRRRQERATASVERSVGEDRRERAELTSLAAKIVMTRRRVERLRESLVDRDSAQAQINRIIAGFFADMREFAADADPADVPLLEAAREVILRDLGDVESAAMRIPACPESSQPPPIIE